MDEKENLENTVENSEFGGTFHERDSLSIKNIVDEVKDSFIDYSMSVIT